MDLKSEKSAKRIRVIDEEEPGSSRKQTGRQSPDRGDGEARDDESHSSKTEDDAEEQEDELTPLPANEVKALEQRRGKFEDYRNYIAENNKAVFQ